MRILKGASFCIPYKPSHNGENCTPKFTIFALMKTWLISVLLLLTSLHVSAQETTSLEPITSGFQGEVSYKIQYSGTGIVEKEAPDSMVITFGVGSWSARWFGGVSKKLKAELLYIGSQNQLWWINHKEWVAYQMDSAYQAPVPTLSNPSKKETKTIKGQPCTKYVAKSNDLVQTFWLSDSLSLNIPSVLDSASLPLPLPWHFGLSGLPLSMEQSSTSGKTITTAVDIRPMAISPATFEIIEGYSRQTFDFFSAHPVLGQ